MDGTGRGPLVPPRAVAIVALVAAVVLAAMLAIQLAHLWMLVFGSVVVAVVLRAIADPLVRLTPLKDGLATFVALLAVVLLLAGVGTVFGQSIVAQVAELSARLPGSVEEVQTQISALPGGAQITEQLSGLAEQAGSALALAPRIAASVGSAVTTLVLVIVAGVFLSASPAASREGVLAVFPLNARPRLREVLNTCGHALKGWLKAQLFSMILVGTLVGVGLMLIGVPAALALALLTGLAQFVPIVGPIVSAVPALLMAATVDPQTILFTLILYVGVSQLESNFITPLVQKNVAALPVVLGIFAVVGIGTLFGPLGVLFATPLALVLLTFVTMLYRQDVLNDHEARAPGQVDEPG